MALDDLYREIILDHYRSPRNKGQLPPPAHKVEGFNPLCGDEVILTVLVEDDKVVDVNFDGQGCSISQASASMMTAAVKGKTTAEAREFITAFKGLMSIHKESLDGDDPEAGEAQLRDDEIAVEDTVNPEIKLGDLAALQGVVKYPVRIKCAVLSWNTLVQSLDELAAESA